MTWILRGLTASDLGNVKLSTCKGPDIERSYDDLMRQRREIILEEQAELSAMEAVLVGGDPNEGLPEDERTNADF